MSFVNRLPDIVPGHGSPAQNDTLFLAQGITLSGNSVQLNYLPTNFANGLKFVPPLSRGKIRVKFTAVSGTTIVMSQVSLVLDDAALGGSNYTEVGRIVSQQLAPGTGGSTAEPYICDRVIEFEIDFAASRLGIATTMTGTNPVVTMDVEISGTTGKPATSPS